MKLPASLRFILAAAILTTATAGLSDESNKAGEFKSYCFNNCSGHGSCANYICTCQPGWHGEDCSVTFSSSPDNVYPPLSVGNAILTSDNYTEYVKSHVPLLVGVSSESCHRCSRVEEEYDKAITTLQANQKQIQFVRVDSVTSHELANRLHCVTIPCLLWVDATGLAHSYTGPHNAESVVEYVTKQQDDPVSIIRSMNSLNHVLQRLVPQKRSARGAVLVLGLFGDVVNDQDEEWEEFTTAAKKLQHRPDVFFSAVHTTALSNADKKLLQRSNGGILVGNTPSLVVVRVASRQYQKKKSTGKKKKKGEDELIFSKLSKLLKHCPTTGELCEQHGTMTVVDDATSRKLVVDVYTTSMLESLPNRLSLDRWIELRSIPLVDHLNPQNFASYEKAALPMLLLFAGAEHFTPKVTTSLDADSSQRDILSTFSDAASFFRDKISFVYTDSRSHSEQMKSLALFEGHKGMPVFAINAGNGQLYPPLEQEKYTVQDLRKYCEEYLANQLPTLTPQQVLEMEREKVSTRQQNLDDDEVQIEEVVGVMESFGPDRTDHIGIVTSATIDKLIWSNFNVDIVLLIHKENHVESMSFAPFFKRCARRLHALGISTLSVLRLDVTHDPLPAQFQVHGVPTLVMLPAFQREPPFLYYSGIGKVLPMMKWIQEHAKMKFDLPELPQFDTSDKELYKAQIEQREKHRQEQEDVKSNEDEVIIEKHTEL